VDTSVLASALAASSVLVWVAGRRFNLPGGMKLKGNSEEILIKAGNRFGNEINRNLLNHKLTQADIDMEPEYFIGLQIALPVVAITASLPFMLAGLVHIYWVVLPVIIIYFVPGVWLNKKAKNRVNAIRADVPEFCILLSNAMESGADLLMALEEVTASMKGELAKEINKTLADIATGDSRAAAFNKLAKRCGVPELTGLVRKITQVMRYGSETLPNMVKHHAEKIRSQQRHDAQKTAGELTIKLLFPIIIFILMPLFGFLGFPVLWHMLKAFA